MIRHPSLVLQFFSSLGNTNLSKRSLMLLYWMSSSPYPKCRRRNITISSEMDNTYSWDMSAKEVKQQRSHKIRDSHIVQNEMAATSTNDCRHPSSMGGLFSHASSEFLPALNLMRRNRNPSLLTLQKVAINHVRSYFKMEETSCYFQTPETCQLLGASGTKVYNNHRHLFCAPNPIWQHRYYSIKRKDYKFPQLNPEDLEETYVRGSGPGGQSVNQTANCVVLKHKPSGIVIKCHDTRSLDENRKRARMRLEERLDEAQHGDQSYLGQLRSSVRDGKQEMKRRANKRLALKKSFKEREGLD